MLHDARTRNPECLYTQIQKNSWNFRFKLGTAGRTILYSERPNSIRYNGIYFFTFLNYKRRQKRSGSNNTICACGKAITKENFYPDPDNDKNFCSEICCLILRKIHNFDLNISFVSDTKSMCDNVTNQSIQEYSIEEWLELHPAHFKQLFKNQNFNSYFQQEDIVIWDTEIDHVKAATPDNIREWSTKSLFIYFRQLFNLKSKNTLSHTRYKDYARTIKNPEYSDKNVCDTVIDFINSSSYIFSYGLAYPDQKRLECVIKKERPYFWNTIEEKFIDFYSVVRLICTKKKDSADKHLLRLKDLRLENVWKRLYKDDTTVPKYKLSQETKKEKCAIDVAMLANIYDVIKKFANKI